MQAERQKVRSSANHLKHLLARYAVVSRHLTSSVTSRCSIETSGRIELVFGMEVPLVSFPLQWRRVHWARLGLSPTFNPPGGARSGLILRKIIKIVATRCHILKVKCTKFDFDSGSRSRPR